MANATWNQGDVAPMLRIRDVLGMPTLANVRVQTYCSQEDLERPIRWVHVADAPRAGHLLIGGELLLTTGIAWGDTPGEREEMITQFGQSKAAAIVLELGTKWQEVPVDVIDSCQRHDLPLLVLQDEVKYVELTENVHTFLLERQVRRITAILQVTESFNSLMVNGAPTLQILDHASRQLKCPVVLEDLSHQVVGYSEGHTLPSKLLAGWSRKSRQWTQTVGAYGTVTQCVSVSRENEEIPRWTMIDVQARGTVWGRLFYCGHSGSDSGGYHILNQAAIALAMERLGSDNPYSWTDLIEKTAIDRMAQNKYTTVQGAQEVLLASGFRTDNRVLLAVLLEHSGEYIEPTVYRKQVRKTFAGADFLAMQLDADPRLVVAALSVPADTYNPAELTAKLTHMGEAIVAKHNSKVRVVHSGECQETLELAEYIRMLSRFRPPPMPRVKVTAVPLSRNPLEGLLLQLSSDVRVQEFVNITLEALITYDAKNDGDLVDTLAAVLANPTSRTAAAEQLHLSRTALYSRIAIIERLLGVDLSNGDEIFALSLAMKAHRPHAERA